MWVRATETEYDRTDGWITGSFRGIKVFSEIQRYPVSNAYSLLNVSATCAPEKKQRSKKMRRQETDACALQNILRTVLAHKVMCG